MLTRLKQMAARMRAFFRASGLDRDFDAELESHVALLVEEHVRRGMTPDRAEREARLELGGLTQIREAHRETGASRSSIPSCRICATRSAPCAATPVSPLSPFSSSASESAPARPSSAW